MLAQRIDVAACFDPHFGAVFYENGIPKEYLTICMACNTIRPSLKIPAMNQGPKEYEGEIYYRLYGFSKEFRKYLSELKQKHGFSHSRLGGIFDD